VLQIKLSNGDITMAEYQCFIRDVKAKNINTENPIPLALTDATWEYLTALEKKSGKFINLTKNIYTSKDKWSDERNTLYPAILFTHEVISQMKYSDNLIITKRFSSVMLICFNQSNLISITKITV
jgi:hypothetical protein